MKWICTVLVAAALTLLFGLPFREYDTAKLLPIRTVQVEQTDAGVHIVSEVGEGTGRTWREAVQSLRAGTPGDVFFETAEQVVFCGRSESIAETVAESGDLRPAAQIYSAASVREPDGLNAYLSAHESLVTLADVRAAAAERDAS